MSETDDIEEAGEILLATYAGVKALGAILFLKDAWEEMTDEGKEAARVVLSDIVHLNPSSFVPHGENTPLLGES